MLMAITGIDDDEFARELLQDNGWQPEPAVNQFKVMTEDGRGAGGPAMPGLTAEQSNLAKRLKEMLTAADWQGIVAQERAALALVRDVRGADPGLAGAILRALGNAHQ